jgi:hypothetical protein
VVKTRAVQLLAKVANFEQLTNNTELNSSLVNGLLQVFASEEGDNADLCLKMQCIEYLKNFYNDHMFRV